MGRYPEAIAALAQAITHRPNMWHGWLYLVSAYALDGKLPTAQEWLQKFESDSPFKGTKFTINKVIAYEDANPAKHEEVKKVEKTVTKDYSKPE